MKQRTSSNEHRLFSVADFRRVATLMLCIAGLSSACTFEQAYLLGMQLTPEQIEILRDEQYAKSRTQSSSVYDAFKGTLVVSSPLVSISRFSTDSKGVGSHTRNHYSLFLILTQNSYTFGIYYSYWGSSLLFFDSALVSSKKVPITGAIRRQFNETLRQYNEQLTALFPFELFQELKSSNKMVFTGRGDSVEVVFPPGYISGFADRLETEAQAVGLQLVPGLEFRPDHDEEKLRELLPRRVASLGAIRVRL